MLLLCAINKTTFNTHLEGMNKQISAKKTILFGYFDWEKYTIFKIWLQPNLLQQITLHFIILLKFKNNICFKTIPVFLRWPAHIWNTIYKCNENIIMWYNSNFQNWATNGKNENFYRADSQIQMFWLGLRKNLNAHESETN